ncbi:MAG: hypothetical protein NVSMB9_29640 [Isosphaeraceae bacterium]
MSREYPMKLPRSFGIVSTILDVITGVASIVGGVILVWGSQDAMLVLIHWIGEGRILGPQNVLLQPDGSKLLTNPSAMAKITILLWGVGASHVIAGGFLFWKCTQSNP